MPRKHVAEPHFPESFRKELEQRMDDHREEIQERFATIIAQKVLDRMKRQDKDSKQL